MRGKLLDGLESSCVGRHGQGFVARITLFHTRIKGLTSLV